MSKFYKLTIQVEVLSDLPFPNDYNLNDVHEQITNGEWVGNYKEVSRKKISKNQMIEALNEVGSDPSFFGIETKE